MKLNFIRSPGTYFYKKHYRTGLRSHIMEVIKREDWKKRQTGVARDGIKWFPKAKPVKMLRIFRTRFETLKEAEEELRRVKVIETFLAPNHLASSQEFLVSYRFNERWEFLLCGLQEFVDGEILDPWSYFDNDHLAFLFSHISPRNNNTEMNLDQWIRTVREKVESFIGNLKEMIIETRHVPDLAGIGNLLLTPSGDIKLVDINNISNVSFGTTIQLDDRGYPVCDKSIEALYRLEQDFVDPSDYSESNIYKTFLDPQRMKEVNAIQEAFHQAMKS